ncbi:Thaumatin-like protein 1, partial [Linum perenne]
FWGRTGCSYDATSNFTCLTGDCGTGKIECNGNPPALPTTIVEFVLSGLVDGFNLPVSIAPVEGNGTCKAKSCEKSVNRVCPPKLAVRNSKGHVVACKSACMAFQKAQYYCEGYTKLFKDTCPQARSYVYDDSASTFTCPTGKDYLITFCP